MVGQRAVSSQAFAFPSINNQSSDLRPASFLSCERVVCKILSFWARDRRALEKEFYNKAPSHNTNQVQSDTDFSSRDERRGVSPRFQADQDSSPQAVAPVIAEHSVFDQITGPQYIGWFIADVTWIYPAHVTWIAIHRPIDCVRAAGLAVAAPPFIAVAPVATHRVIGVGQKNGFFVRAVGSMNELTALNGRTHGSASARGRLRLSLLWLRHRARCPPHRARLLTEELLQKNAQGSKRNPELAPSPSRRLPPTE